MKVFWLYLMATFYLVAGFNHFIHPQGYIGIMPPWLPFSLALVYISGGIEIVLALLLITRFSRRWAAWGIIVLLILVFPANIQMSINYYREDNPRFWLSLLRLPIQFLLIYWAYKYTKPFALNV